MARQAYPWLPIRTGSTIHVGTGQQLGRAVVRECEGSQAAPPAGRRTLHVALVVIGRQELLDPLAAVRLERLGQPDRVRRGESHVAVEHQWKVGAHLGAALGKVGDVGLEAGIALRRAVRARDLGARKAHRLRRLRLRRCAVDGQAVLGLASEQRVHRLVAELAQQVPERQIDGGDGLQRKALAPIVGCGAPHHVVHLLDIARVLAFHEAAQVLLNNITCRFATCGDADSGHAIFRLDLYDT